MSLTFVYFHGFASQFDPDNLKVRALETVGDVIGITYDCSASFDSIKSHITNEIVARDIDLFETVFIGTSLGAYWAAEMGRIFGGPAVLINPCYDPYNMLRKRVGNNFNFQTGQTFVFSEQSCDSYYNKQIDLGKFVYKPLILLDEGDEIIDSNETARQYSHGSVISFAGGSHRFEHMKEALSPILYYFYATQTHCSGESHVAVW